MKTAIVGIILCAALLTGAAQAQTAASARQTADAWLAAYEAQDFDAVRSLLTDESVFIDPTSFGRANVVNTIDWTGPEEIISGISGWGLAAAEYSFDRVYESPGRVIYDGSVLVTYQNGASYDYPIITIVTVADGRLVEHRDYTDFDGATRVESN
jgi:limonene-1,2-epoxide hydrolase